MKIKKKKTQYKVLAVFRNGNVLLIKDFKLLPNRYVQIGSNEPFPIEDCGNWILLKEDVTEEEAFQAFLKEI